MSEQTKLVNLKEKLDTRSYVPYVPSLWVPGYLWT